VFADPQVQHLGLAQSVAHPRLGDLTLVGQPIGISDLDAAPRSAAPEKGAHTDEVLRGLGFDQAAIADLKARGVV
jgi:crotonobetainyl-CoA:carnitine CoA-transferase CaiB-like acyl-CoA transferase